MIRENHKPFWGRSVFKFLHDSSVSFFTLEPATSLTSSRARLARGRARQMEAYQYFISLVKRDECLQHEQPTNPRSCSPVSRKCLPSSPAICIRLNFKFQPLLHPWPKSRVSSITGPLAFEPARNEIVINVASRYTSMDWKSRFKTPAIGDFWWRGRWWKSLINNVVRIIFLWWHWN